MNIIKIDISTDIFSKLKKYIVDKIEYLKQWKLLRKHNKYFKGMETTRFAFYEYPGQGSIDEDFVLRHTVTTYVKTYRSTYEAREDNIELTKQQIINKLIQEHLNNLEQLKKDGKNRLVVRQKFIYKSYIDICTMDLIHQISCRVASVPIDLTESFKTKPIRNN